MTVYATQSATASPSVNVSVDDLLDEMLNDLSTNPKKPNTPEDTFVNYFVGDKFGKVVILVHWLRNQIAIYDRMAEYGMCLASIYNKDGLKRADFKRYVRVLIEHYLMQSHPHWFIAGSGIQGRVPADMGTVIDRLLEIEKIRNEVFSKNRT